MASPKQLPDSVQKTPLAPEIFAETKRLLGCLLTPKDSTSGHSGAGHKLRNHVNTATGVSSHTGSEHSGASNVGLVATQFAQHGNCFLI